MNFKFLILFLFISYLSYADEFKIKQKPISYIHTISVKTITEKEEAIVSPSRNLSIDYIANNGQKVEKGETITRFDNSNIKEKLESLNLDLAIAEIDLTNRLDEIDSRDLEMHDRLETLNDNLAVYQAQLSTAKTLPLIDEVRIAEGKLSIAKMNHSAANKDFDKAKERFKNKMISRAEYDKFEEALMERNAQLSYANNFFELESLPVASSTIKKLELSIENIELEINKLKIEIKQYEQISSIKKASAQTGKKIMLRKKEDILKRIDKTTVVAPISGYAKYVKSIGVGTRFSWEKKYMTIPDLTTIALKGKIKEAFRNHLKKGDLVTIAINGRQTDLLQGTVKTVGTRAKDLAEKDTSDWGESKEYGIKAYDIIITLNTPPPWLHIGMFGKATIKSNTVIEKTYAPLKFIKTKNNDSYVSINGEFKKVKGLPLLGEFIFDNNKLNGVTIDSIGEFNEDIVLDENGENVSDEFFTASGELKPINAQEVRVPDIGTYAKISWLIDEESTVVKGDVVAKIDSEKMENVLEDSENRYNDELGRLKELHKERSLKLQDGEFKVKTAKNELAIAQIDLDTALKGLDYAALFSSEMNHEIANIRLNGLRKKLKRYHEKKTSSLSPIQLKSLERDIKRQELNAEASSINLEKLRSGSDKIGRSDALLTYLEKKIKVSKTLQTVEKENFSMNKNVRTQEISIKWNKKRLDKQNERLANMTVYSPGNGVIQYEKVWSGGGISKIAVGNMVGDKFNIMSIPETSTMYMSVEVPEKYYSYINPRDEVKIKIPSLGKRRINGIVEKVDLIFENKEKKSNDIGLYSSHEPLGEVIFRVKINLINKDHPFKSGSIGTVYFPFK